MKCNECGFDYPEEILAPLMTSSGNVASVCGICALELSNQVLGVERTEFQGEIAESFRLEALRIRKEKKK